MCLVFREIKVITLWRGWLMYEKMGGSDPLASVSDLTNAIITIGAEVAGIEDKRMARATSCQSQPRANISLGATECRVLA